MPRKSHRARRADDEGDVVFRGGSQDGGLADQIEPPQAAPGPPRRSACADGLPPARKRQGTSASPGACARTGRPSTWRRAGMPRKSNGSGRGGMVYSCRLPTCGRGVRLEGGKRVTKVIVEPTSPSRRSPSASRSSARRPAPLEFKSPAIREAECTEEAEGASSAQEGKAAERMSD